MKRYLAMLLAMVLLLGSAGADVLEADFSAESMGLLELDSLDEGLEIRWKAGKATQYKLELLDSEPAGEAGEKGQLIFGGMQKQGRIFVEKELLEAGKYLKLSLRGITRLDWNWSAWKINARMNYRGSAQEAMQIVDVSREVTDAVAGRMRRVGQNRSDPWFTRAYWESKKYNFVYGGDQLSNSMCTRANYCMALSYLGIAVSPVEMSEISRSKQVDHDPRAPYDELTAKLSEQYGVQIERVTGELDELFENYASDSSYSPVYLRLRRKDGRPHVFLVVGRDDEYYYAVDSVERDGVYVHAIRVNDEGNRILKDENTACWEKYFNAKIIFCHQWKLAAETE